MTCPTPQLLQERLEGMAPGAQRSTIDEHVKTCEACQSVLGQLASRSPRITSVGPMGRDTQGSTVIQTAYKNNRLPQSPNEEPDAAGRLLHGTDLAFLDPSVNAHSIGRLGRYDILSLIGRGGFGIVLKAFDDLLHRIVAIKVMAPQVATNANARQRFIREAIAAAAVSHENVVTIHEVVTDAPMAYIVMQFVNGTTLHNKIEKKGALGLKEILRIGIQTAEGLSAVHEQRRVHRDIKPDNILLENGVERVKITDFGLARAVDDASVTNSGAVAGTPMFMAPEQASGEFIDHRADLFSLGSVLYTMCTGRPPFRAETTMGVMKRVCEDIPRPIRETNPDIPVRLCEVISRLHAKNREDRFQSAQELADQLTEFLAELQFQGRLATPLASHANVAASATSVTPLPKRRRLLVAVVVASLIGILSLAAWALWASPSSAVPLPDKSNEQPVASAIPTLAVEKWKQLFNGKDLTGWKEHPQQSGGWSVENGLLVGRAFKDAHQHLFSERADYENFHLRAQVKLQEDGLAAVLFRSSFDLQSRGKDPLAYEARLLHNNRALQNTLAHDSGSKKTTKKGMSKLRPMPRTGSLLKLTNKNALELSATDDKLVPPGEWCNLEIITQGKRFVIKVNGETTADFEDRDGAFPRGHLALLAIGHPKTIVYFKKLEILEMPATSPQDELGRLPLANGKFLASGASHRAHADREGGHRLEELMRGKSSKNDR